MQTNQVDNSAKFERSLPNHDLQLFRGPEQSVDRDTLEPKCGNPNQLPLTKALVDSFAAATGWELAQIGSEIKIVDMSASWPAKTPTAHRGKCDRFAEELSKLVDCQS